MASAARFFEGALVDGRGAALDVVGPEGRGRFDFAAVEGFADRPTDCLRLMVAIDVVTAPLHALVLAVALPVDVSAPVDGVVLVLFATVEACPWQGVETSVLRDGGFGVSGSSPPPPPRPRRAAQRVSWKLMEESQE